MRATLLTSEINDLQENYGEYLFYHPLFLDRYIHFQSSLCNCNQTPSTESNILSNLLTINAEADLHLSDQLRMKNRQIHSSNTFSFEEEENPSEVTKSSSSLSSLSLPSLIPLSSEDDVLGVYRSSLTQDKGPLSRMQERMRALMVESSPVMETSENEDNDDDETLGGFLVHSSDAEQAPALRRVEPCALDSSGLEMSQNSSAGRRKKRMKSLIDEIDAKESSYAKREEDFRKNDFANKENGIIDNESNVENSFLDSESSDFQFRDTSDAIKESGIVTQREEAEQFEFSESSSFVSESSAVIDAFGISDEG